MNNIFFTEKNGNFTLPIPADGFTVNDPNNEFSDGIFVNWSYPFTVKLTAELKRIFGDLTDTNNVKKIKKTEGFLNRDGIIDVAVLNFISSKFDEAKFQFELGIESLLIGEKKLSEFDLGEVTYGNLYDYIDANKFKTYPDINVYFREIEFPKELYKEDEFILDFGFQHRFNKASSSGIVRNSFTNYGQIVKNIIRPTVPVLHILKTGFQLAGYSLKGDILTDLEIKKLSLNHNQIAEEIASQDIKKIPYDVTQLDINNKTVQEFYLIGAYNFSLLLENDTNNFDIKIKDESGAIIFEYTKVGQLTHYDEDQSGQPITVVDGNIELFHEMPLYNELTKIIVEIVADPRENFVNTQTLIYTAYFNPKRQGQITEKKVFAHKDKIILNEYVPDITFNDLLATIRKIKNYRIDVRYNEIWFLNPTVNFTQVKDLSFSEQQDVEIFSNDKKTVVFSYKAPKEYEFMDVLFKDDGTVQSGDNLESGNKIDLNYTPLPIFTEVFYYGPNQEFVFRNEYYKQKTNDSSGIELLAYLSGTELDFDRKNVFSIEYIAENQYKNTIRNMLSADVFKWSFNSANPVLRDLKSSDTIAAYQCFHRIQNLVKKYFEDKDGNIIYHIELETHNRY